MDEREHIPDCVVEYWLREHEDDSDLAEEAAHSSPRMFAEFFRDGERWGIHRTDLAEHAGLAWDRWGGTCLSHEEWRDLFELAGYREDDCPADRSTEPLTLWRGATPEFRANWSWTDVRDAAIQYTSGWLLQREIGLVWRAVMEPERLLAKINGPIYSEYVVDTEGLTIEPDGLWCRCAVDMEPFRAVDGARVALDLHELIECPRL